MWPRFLTATLLTLGLAAACAAGGGAGADRVRNYTYPADFRYITEHEVESHMWTMARSVQAMNELLRRPQPLSPAERAQIVSLLDAMATTTRALEPPRGRSNHPMLDKNIGFFIRDLEQAKLDAQHEPPNYFLAGSVGGTCIYCHPGT